MRSSVLLPFIQDDSQVRLRSTRIFQEMMGLLTAEGKKALKSHVRQSLLPLSFHCHDEDGHVADVRTRGLPGFPWEGARPPPALAPHGLQHPPGLGTRTRVLCPGLWCHLPVSAALQASREALHCAASFLKRRDLERVLDASQTRRFGEGLVRTAWKPKSQPGEAP